MPVARWKVKRMKLIKLEDGNAFYHKKLICIGRSAAYINELCRRYPVLERIEAVVDGDSRNQGEMVFSGKKIPVRDLTFLKREDLSDRLLLITDDYYRELYDKIFRLLGESGAVGDVYFFADRETEYELYYREKYKNAPLENIIVFRSGPHASGYVEGMDFSDNARALFEYAISTGLNEKYELIWFVKSPAAFSEYQKYKNVSFLPCEGSVSDCVKLRDSYYRVLCLAKYFFFTDAYGFVRNCRKDQIRVQLWHGCGYKKRLNTVSCRKRYDYMTVTSSLYAQIHAKEFGLRRSQMLITGCAKTDWLFKFSPEIQDTLRIPKADKYLFWLPTYRFSEKKMNKPVDGELKVKTGLPLVADMEEMENINRRLVRNNMILVIKPHPFQDSAVIAAGNFSNIILLKNELLVKYDIQTNQLLAAADALISDYSSTAVDYLVLNRPMAFLVDDAGSYSDRRGFVFEDIFRWLPGKKVFDINGFYEFIEEIGGGRDEMKEMRTNLRRKMHCYQDGSNCRRILEALKIPGD